MHRRLQSRAWKICHAKDPSGFVHLIFFWKKKTDFIAFLNQIHTIGLKKIGILSLKKKD